MKTEFTYSLITSIRKAASILSLLLLLLSASAFAQNNITTCAIVIGHYPSTSNPDSIHYYGYLPTGTTGSYTWDFGDGSNPSHEPLPWHLYANSGAYKVCVSVVIGSTGGSTCTADTCDSVFVNVTPPPPPPPVCSARFFSYSLQTNPDSVHFYTYIPAGATAQYTWNFGDGSNPSHDASPWHVYSRGGGYKACLSITIAYPNAATCSADTCDSVHIALPPPPICSAAFQHYSLPANPDSIHFYSSNTTNTANGTYSWDFGDGTPVSNEPYPWHLYTHDGKYRVCLSITIATPGGLPCTADSCDTIYIRTTPPPLCNAKFVHYSLASNPDSVHFYVTPTPAAGTKYYWIFGDNTASSTEPSPWHLYANNHTYRVCLYVSDSTAGGKCTASECDSVHVGGPPPVCSARFQHYSLTNNPDSVHFYAVTSTSTTSKYSWDFGDATSGGHTSDPWHLYGGPGKYLVCLTVTDSTAGGTCSDMWCDTVVISPPPSCNSDFKIYRTGSNTNAVYFVGAQDPPGTVYTWSFGDNSPNGSGQTVTHTYTQDGGYKVCLTVVNTAVPCSANSCDSVHIITTPPPTCNAKFVHYASATNPDSIHFYITPANLTTAKYRWFFGDGDSSHLADPWHLYAGAGKYRVCVIVADSTPAGVCLNYSCDSVLVTSPPPPACNAQFGHYSLNNPDSVHFYSNNTAAPTTTKYTWSFGDGSNDSHDRFPWHLYPGPGAYKVCLTVTDTIPGSLLGCEDSHCDSIHILPPPPPCNPRFTHVAANSINTAIHFIPAPNAPHTSYSWDFGDQTAVSTDSSPTHTYTNYGTYWVCLTVTNTAAISGACTQTWCDSVHVGIKPAICDARFTFRYASNPFSVYFISDPNAPGTTYTWDFGDGSSPSHDQNAMHQYTGVGLYNVCLTVENTITNCQAQWCFKVPVAGFSPFVCNSNFAYLPGPTAHSLYFLTVPNPPSTKYLWKFGDGDSATTPDAFHQFAAGGPYTVCLTVTDTVALCSDQRCLTINAPRMASGGSTIEQSSDALASIYPNPVTESAILHIENMSGAVTFRMYDNVGRLVNVMSNLTNGEFELSRQGLRAGLYIYEVTDGSNNVSRGRIVIQ